MDGVDPYTYLQKISGRIDSLVDRDEIESVLDDIEFLYEIISPEMQDLADPVITSLRRKLKICQEPT